jgi:hypothetical protein
MTLIETGEKLLVIYRAIYEGSVRMHFLGEVETAEGSICRLSGHIFSFNQLNGIFVK